MIVFCYKTNDSIRRELHQELRDVKIVLFNIRKAVLFALTHPASFWSSFGNRRQSKQALLRRARSLMINRYAPDIVHFEFSGIGIEFLSEISMLKAKTVVSCRGSAEKVKLLISPERREKFAKLLDVVDAVHCVSADMQHTIRPYCKQPGKIFINYPSINTRFFKRVSHERPKQKNIVLSVGRLTFQKGYAAGLMAMKMLKNAGIPFHWIIMGNGNKFEELVFKTRQLGLQHEVKLVGSGSREEVRELMEAATVFFLPSVYEGIANVVLEAMSMELPVVSSKCGGMEEVITHGKDGLLADVYDYADMAHQLQLLLTDDELYKSIAAHSRQTIVESFGIEKQTDRFDHIYHNLINKRPATAVPSKLMID